MTLEEPVPPTNVRVERADGTVDPLELIYAGIEDNTHIWEAVLTVLALRPGDHLAMDRIPANTAIRVSTQVQPVDDSLDDWLDL